MSDSDTGDNVNRNRRINAINNHDYNAVQTSEFEMEEREKPWQRVPSVVLILVLGIYFLLGFFTQLVEDGMPAVILETDVDAHDYETFSEESANRYLARIIGKEPRVAGTKYHRYMTEDLKDMIDGIAAKSLRKVRTDLQIASGDFFRNGSSSSSYFSVYQNTSNIIALLEGASGFHSNGSIGSAILVNCHYDSVPFALGASDNAVFCAAMAEALEKMSRAENILFRRHVIFLFNGAEENGLQASHAFLQHPWAEGVTAVINLDSAGMNGKPTIFQVTDPRVLSAYRRSARRPNAQGVAQFLFSSGVIPSDTDFRIFRDFGNITGVDIAFAKWAHVYHTRNDRAELLRAGVVQCAGDMLLALLVETAAVDDLDEKVTPTGAVYYDYLNVFLLEYSSSASYVIDVLIALCGLSSVGYYIWIVGLRKSTVYKLGTAMVGRILSMGVGVVVGELFVLIMVATTIQMRYLTQAWIVVPLYWMPFVLAAVATAQAFDAWTLKSSGLSRSLRCVQASAATRALLCVALLVLAFFSDVTSLRYIFTVPLFIMSITSLISMTIIRYFNLKGWHHLILEMALSLPVVMWVMSLALRVDAQMLPIMARSAKDRPDYTVASLNIALAVLTACTVSGMELLFSRKRLWMVLTFLGSICLVLMFIPFNPYEDEGISLQRHYWFHTEIVSYNYKNETTSRSAGVVVSKLDPYTTARVQEALSRAGHHVSVRDNLTADCSLLVHCGLPLFRTSAANQLVNALFLYTGPPAPFDPPPSARVIERTCEGTQCTYAFVFTVAPHNMMTLWPQHNVSVSSWTLGSPPRASFHQLDRPVYVLYHSVATYTQDHVEFPLNVTFHVPLSLQSQAIVDVSHHAHKIHHPELFTSEYANILKTMPQYFNIASFISFRNNYEF